MKPPRYTYPLRLLPGLAADLLLGRQRSFRGDALACIRGLHPPLRVLGEGNIPVSGPCVLTLNHYHRPGFGAWWLALAAAATVPVEMHWVMTGELTFPGKPYAFVGRPISRWLLGRVSRMYGFTSMPPMPPRAKDVAARAHSVRAVLGQVRRNPAGMLAVSPEGGDAPGGALTQPPPGAGRFLLLLAEAGFSFVPLGCWEEEALCLRFGRGYRLDIPPGLGAGARDACASGIVMAAIASLLPSHLRGAFNWVQPNE